MKRRMALAPSLTMERTEPSWRTCLELGAWVHGTAYREALSAWPSPEMEPGIRFLAWPNSISRMRGDYFQFHFIRLIGGFFRHFERAGFQDEMNEERDSEGNGNGLLFRHYPN